MKVKIILGGLLLARDQGCDQLRQVVGTDVGSLWWLVGSAADELT
jgi:hypothetical protein